MTEAPDVYPDFPDDEEQDASDEGGVEGELGAVRQPRAVRTGDARVDAVIDTLEGLDERPIGEHARVFERAHDALRAALDPDQEPDQEPDRESA